MCMLREDVTNHHTTDQARIQKAISKCTDEFVEERNFWVGYKVVDRDNINPFVCHGSYKYQEGYNTTQLSNNEFSRYAHEGFHVVATVKGAHAYLERLVELSIGDDFGDMLSGRGFKVIKVLVPNGADVEFGYTMDPMGITHIRNTSTQRTLVTDQLLVESLDAIEN